MSDNKHKEKKTLKLPNNIDLAFFAYGIFKPGQLAHSKIKNHIDKIENNKEYTTIKNAQDVPDICNEFINEFLFPDKNCVLNNPFL